MNKKLMIKIQVFIKIVLSVLFLLCLLDMPYGYYEAVRFAGMLGFTLLSYFSYVQKNTTGIIVYISLALLFQPFIKIALGRTIWNIVDIIIAFWLISSLFVKSKEEVK